MAERERLDISCKEAPIDYLAFFHFLHGGVPGPMEFDLWHAQGGAYCNSVNFTLAEATSLP